MKWLFILFLFVCAVAQERKLDALQARIDAQQLAIQRVGVEQACRVIVEAGLVIRCAVLDAQKETK